MTYTAGGVNWTTVQAALHQWVTQATGLAPEQVIWDQQQAPRPTQPSITMRIANMSTNGQPWTHTETNTLTFTDKMISAVDATANTLTSVAHGLLTGDGPVRVASTGTLPGGLVANTDYWFIRTSSDVFQLASTFAHTGGETVANGGHNALTAIDLSSVGSGTITLEDTVDTLRAGAEINFVSNALEQIVLELECRTTIGVGMEMATSILHRIVARQGFPSLGAILEDQNIGLTDVRNVRAIHGVRNSVVFTPICHLDVWLSIPSQDAEVTTIIERAVVTDLDTNAVFDVPA